MQSEKGKSSDESTSNTTECSDDDISSIFDGGSSTTNEATREDSQDGILRADWDNPWDGGDDKNAEDNK